MSSLAVVHAGFMTKRGDWHGFWQSRWFVLQRNGDMHYYMVEKGGTAATDNDTHRGVINLAAATSISRLAPSSTTDFSFAITTLGRAWKLDPGSVEEYNAWSRAFEPVRSSTPSSTQ